MVAHGFGMFRYTFFGKIIIIIADMYMLGTIFHILKFWGKVTHYRRNKTPDACVFQTKKGNSFKNYPLIIYY